MTLNEIRTMQAELARTLDGVGNAKLRFAFRRPVFASNACIDRYAVRAQPTVAFVESVFHEALPRAPQGDYPLDPY